MIGSVTTKSTKGGSAWVLKEGCLQEKSIFAKTLQECMCGWGGGLSISIVHLKHEGVIGLS